MSFTGSVRSAVIGRVIASMRPCIVEGYRSFWMHPSIPVQFHRTRRPIGKMNQLWVERLFNEANRPDGLWLVREPEETGEPETRNPALG